MAPVKSSKCGLIKKNKYPKKNSFPMSSKRENLKKLMFFNVKLDYIGDTNTFHKIVFQNFEIHTLLWNVLINSK